MPHDKQPKQPVPKHDLLDKLFGDPSEMPDEDLNMLFEALFPAADAAAAVYQIAEEAAVEYRTQNRVPPNHVQAALEAAREVKSLDTLEPSKLRQIVDALSSPFKGAVKDPIFAYRNRDGELDEEDKRILDDLTEELQRGWEDDDEAGGK